jgi:hypothetical protein
MANQRRKASKKGHKELRAFRFPKDLADAMDKLQERDGISQSEMARRALRPFLERKGVLKPRKR